MSASSNQCQPCWQPQYPWFREVAGVELAKVRSPKQRTSSQWNRGKKSANCSHIVPTSNKRRSAEPREAGLLLPKEDQLGRHRRRILTPASSHFHIQGVSSPLILDFELWIKTWVSEEPSQSTRARRTMRATTKGLQNATRLPRRIIVKLSLWVFEHTPRFHRFVGRWTHFGISGRLSTD